MMRLCLALRPPESTRESTTIRSVPVTHGPLLLQVTGPIYAYDARVRVASLESGARRQPRVVQAADHARKEVVFSSYRGRDLAMRAADHARKSACIILRNSSKESVFTSPSVST